MQTHQLCLCSLYKGGWGINLKGEGVPRHAGRQSRSALINWTCFDTRQNAPSASVFQQKTVLHGHDYHSHWSQKPFKEFHMSTHYTTISLPDHVLEHNTSTQVWLFQHVPLKAERAASVRESAATRHPSQHALFSVAHMCSIRKHLENMQFQVTLHLHRIAISDLPVQPQ